MKKSIIIIDDNPLNCEDFIAPLREHYNTTVCMSIRDAERKISLHRYDLIVIDIMMPTSDLLIKDDLRTGLIFYEERLKPLEKERPLLRFLFWSNLSKNSYEEFFAKYKPKPSNVDFLHKEPRNKNHLLEKVNELIG